VTLRCCGFKGKNWKKLGRKSHLSEASFLGKNIDNAGNFDYLALNYEESER